MRQDLPAATAADVRAAAGRLAGVAVRTPLLEHQGLNEQAGMRVLLKAESLQICGSFKVRGAYNLLAQAAPAARARGVVAWSSGNHAQGVAYAARRLGVPAAIVMPADAPAVKIAATEALGAEIIFYDRWTQDREAIARALCEARGALLAPSYDHPHIIAGQGTVGLEIIEQAQAMGAIPDAILACCSGGGLAAGIALGAEAAGASAQMRTVEPEGFDDMARSLAASARQHNAGGGASLCDALLAPEPGALTLPILAAKGAQGLVVSEAEVRAAVRFAFAELRLVVEPGGAAALAAVLAGKARGLGPVVALTLSGANVDPAVFASLIA